MLIYYRDSLRNRQTYVTNKYRGCGYIAQLWQRQLSFPIQLSVAYRGYIGGGMYSHSIYYGLSLFYIISKRIRYSKSVIWFSKSDIYILHYVLIILKMNSSCSYIKLKYPLLPKYHQCIFHLLIYTLAAYVLKNHLLSVKALKYSTDFKLVHPFPRV